MGGADGPGVAAPSEPPQAASIDPATTAATRPVGRPHRPAPCHRPSCLPLRHRADIARQSSHRWVGPSPLRLASDGCPRVDRRLAGGPCRGGGPRADRGIGAGWAPARGRRPARPPISVGVGDQPGHRAGRPRGHRGRDTLAGRAGRSSGGHCASSAGPRVRSRARARGATGPTGDRSYLLQCWLPGAGSVGGRPLRHTLRPLSARGRARTVGYGRHYLRS